MKEQIRQGDVLLNEIDVGRESLEDNIPIAQDRKVLAYGEKTGHSHVLTGDVNFYNATGNQVLCRVNSGAQLVHEEHRNIDIPKGDYLVIIQREFDAVRGIRRVMD
jgi:hypothetical protein